MVFVGDGTAYVTGSPTWCVSPFSLYLFSLSWHATLNWPFSFGLIGFRSYLRISDRITCVVKCRGLFILIVNGVMPRKYIGQCSSLIFHNIIWANVLHSFWAISRRNVYLIAFLQPQIRSQQSYGFHNIAHLTQLTFSPSMHCDSFHCWAYRIVINISNIQFCWYTGEYAFKILDHC